MTPKAYFDIDGLEDGISVFSTECGWHDAHDGHMMFGSTILEYTAPEFVGCSLWDAVYSSGVVLVTHCCWVLNLMLNKGKYRDADTILGRSEPKE